MSTLDKYTVKKGENFHVIAKKLKVNVAELKALNASYKGGIYVKQYTYKERDYGLDPGDILLIPQAQIFTVEKAQQNWNSNGRPVAVVAGQNKPSESNLEIMVVNASKPKDTRADEILQASKDVQDYTSTAQVVLSGADALKGNNNIFFSWFTRSQSLDPTGRIVGGLTPNITPSSTLKTQVALGSKYKNAVPYNEIAKTANKFSSKLGVVSNVADAVEVGVHIAQGDTEAAKEKIIKTGVSAGVSVPVNAIAGRICPRFAAKSPTLKGVAFSGLCFIGINIGGNEAADALAPLANALPEDGWGLEEYRRQQIEKDPMLEYHLPGAD